MSAGGGARQCSTGRARESLSDGSHWPLNEGQFSLALRSTSPSVELIAQSRRIALSAVPIHLANQAIALGKHHRLANISYAELPFEVSKSTLFGLPIPAASLGVLELEIEQVHVIGSHTLFLGVPLLDTRRFHGTRMFHISGLYQSYLRQRGRLPA